MAELNLGATPPPNEGTEWVIRSKSDLKKLAPFVPLKDLVRVATGRISVDSSIRSMARHEIIRRFEFIVNEEKRLVDVVVPSAEAVALCTELGLDKKYAKAINALVEIGNIKYRDLEGIGRVDLMQTVPSVDVPQPREDSQAADNGHQIVKRGTVSPTEFEELLRKNKMSGVHEDENGTYVWVDLPTGGSLTLKLDETKKEILKRLGLFDEFTTRLHAYHQWSLADREQRRISSVQKVEKIPTIVRPPNLRFSTKLFPKGIPRTLELGDDPVNNLDKALRKLRARMPTGSTIRVSDNKPPRIFLRVPKGTEGDEFEDIEFDVESLANAIPYFGKEWKPVVPHESPSFKIPKLNFNNEIFREVEVFPEPEEEPEVESSSGWGSFLGSAVKKGVDLVGGLFGSSVPKPPPKPEPTTMFVREAQEIDEKTASIIKRLEQIATALSRIQEPFSSDVSQMLFDLGIDEDERLKMSRDGKLAGIGNDLLEVGRAIFGDKAHESEIEDIDFREQLSNYWVKLQDALEQVAANLVHHPGSFATKSVAKKTPILTGKDPAATIQGRQDYTRMAKVKQEPEEPSPPGTSRKSGVTQGRGGSSTMFATPIDAWRVFLAENDRQSTTPRTTGNGGATIVNP